MNYGCISKLISLAIICGVFGIIHADPVVFLKNNSDRVISVEPLAENKTFPIELKKADDEYILPNDGGNRITGLRIKYCPAKICDINDKDGFNKTAKSTTFYFDAPKAKKYYVKLTIDSQDKVFLEAQKGSFGRTSNMKWSLSDNIKTDEIKSTPPRPQQVTPERIRQAVPKVGISSSTTPLFSQPAEISKGLPDVDKRLQEINEELKKLQQLAAAKNITRGNLESIEGRLDTAHKKLKDLKDEIALMHYEPTSSEVVLLQEIDESFVNMKNTISRLRDFLKMPSINAPSLQKVGRAEEKIGLEWGELTTEERQKILQAIKTLAPALYDLMIKEDPTGKNHIFLDPYDRGMSIRPSWTTGLPVIAIERESLHWPWGETLFVVGHELAHYVLGDLLDEYHNDYPVENTMKLARQRLRENECDRMSILEFGANIDDGIAHYQYIIKKIKEDELRQPYKETFKKDHALSVDRIKYLESLRREVELQKAHNKSKAPIDWKKIVQENKTAGQEQPINASLVQKYMNKVYTQDDLDRYIDKVNVTYKNIGDITFVQQFDQDTRGKQLPWTAESIRDILDENLYDLKRSLRERTFTLKEDENKLISHVLHMYYNAKLFTLWFQDDAKKIAIKAALEELLNTKIQGNTVTNIIQRFEQ